MLTFLAACVTLYRDVGCKMMWTPLHPIVYHHFPHCLVFFSQKLQDSANFFHINFPKTISHHFSLWLGHQFSKTSGRRSQRRSALPERPGTLGRTGMSRSLDSLTWDPDWFRSVSWVQFSETLWLCQNSWNWLQMGSCFISQSAAGSLEWFDTHTSLQPCTGSRDLGKDRILEKLTSHHPKNLATARDGKGLKRP